MTDLEDRLHEELDSLRTLRDELRVKLHLGSAEIRDQWENLEKAWNHAEARLGVLRRESRESAEEVGEAARLLLDELRTGYHRLRDLV